MKLAQLCPFLLSLSIFTPFLGVASRAFSQVPTRELAHSPFKPRMWASENSKKSTRDQSSRKQDSAVAAKYKDYKVTQFPDYEIPPFLSREDLNKIIPSGVKSSDPSGQVLQKMSDKAVNVWLKSSAMKDVALVQTANRVENAMKAEVELAPTDSDVRQKLNFQIQAFQSLSKMDYKGYVDASVSYNLREQKAGYEVRQRVLKNKDLYVNHTTSREEDLSSVGLKWAF